MAQSTPARFHLPIDFDSLCYEIPNQLSLISAIAKELAEAIDHVLTCLRFFRDNESFWLYWERLRQLQLKMAKVRFARSYRGLMVPHELRLNELLQAAADHDTLYGIPGEGEIGILNELANKVQSLYPPSRGRSKPHSDLAIRLMKKRLPEWTFPSQQEIRAIASAVGIQANRAKNKFEKTVQRLTKQEPGRSNTVDKSVAVTKAGADASDLPPPSVKRVELKTFNEAPVVLGKKKKTLTKAQYDVVQALLNAGESGLTKDELDIESRHGDARKVLSRLKESDPGWNEVIHLPGVKGRGYRIE